MAWFELHQSLYTHRKTLRVCTALGLSRRELVSHLVMLWWWGLDNADQNGRLGDVTSYEIAAAAEWPMDDADRFVEALLNAGRPNGFLEKRRRRTGEPEFVLHNWHKYAGKLIAKKEKNAARMRDTRAKETGARASHKPARASQEERRGEERKEEREEERRSPSPRAAAGAHPLGSKSDADWDFARSLYENHIGPLDARTRDDLRKLFDLVPDAKWLNAAINQAATADHPGFGYVKRVVEDCVNKNQPPSTLVGASNR